MGIKHSKCFVFVTDISANVPAAGAVQIAQLRSTSVYHGRVKMAPPASTCQSLTDAFVRLDMKVKFAA